MEESLKLYKKLQKKRHTHRTVPVSDIRLLEVEFSMENAANELNSGDSKKHLIKCLVNKMFTL